MRIYVKVNANSSQDKLEKISKGQYKARLVDPPVHGKANAKLISLLAVHFGVKNSAVRIVGGKTSPSKMVDIDLAPR